MNKSSPIKGSFEYRSETITVVWYDIPSKLPDLPWQQVYVVGLIGDKVPIVHYDGDDNDNLPGGGTEAGETADDTIKREILEELNCAVEKWVPLGYQECTNESGQKLYQLRVAAKLRVIGPFEKDPGGAVVGYSLVPPESLNVHIKYGAIGDRLVSLFKDKKSQL